MRTFYEHLFIFMTLSWLLIMLSFLSGCQSKTPQSTTVIALVDHTDDHVSNTFHFDAATILELVQAKRNPAMDIDLTHSLITEVSFNHTAQISYHGGNGLMENPLVQQQQLAEFKTAIDSSFSTLSADNNAGSNSSEIYSSLCYWAHELMESNAERKILLISSNMLENTSRCSFIGNNEQLKSNPAYFQSLLEEDGCILPDMTGAEVFIIYPVTTQEDNDAFIAAAGFFKKLLQNKDATVEIAANL